MGFLDKKDKKMKKKFLSMILATSMIMSFVPCVHAATVEPTIEPTVLPTDMPTTESIAEPTSTPTIEPTAEPTPTPTPTEETPKQIIDSGICGEKLTWELAEDGTLTISGTGDMTNYLSNSEVPWCNYRDYIKRIVVNEGVTTICRYLFSTNITSVDLPNSLKSIPNGAFEGCSLLNKITLPQDIERIEDGTFMNCSSLTEITIPENVEYIGRQSFADCSSLAEITIPENVTIIGEDAFFGCAGLKKVYFNAINCKVYYETTDEVDVYFDIFQHPAIWSDINEVVFGENVTRIPAFAFTNNLNLTKVMFPETLKEIGNCAFAGTGLTEITIPINVENIGLLAFYNCDKIEKVYFNAKNCTYGEDRFDNVDDISNVEDFCVGGIWSNVKKVVFGDNVTQIPDAAFMGSKDLLMVALPKTLKGIGSYAFFDTGLKQIDIPERTTSIGKAAFSHCSDLENIFVDSKNLRYYSDDGVLLNNYQNRLLTIPGAKAEYVIPDTVKYIESYAGSGNTKLSEITLTENITDTGENMFIDSTGLESVSYNCDELIFKAFMNCSNLTNLKLGENVELINGNALSGCTSLKELTIPENVKHVVINHGLDDKCDESDYAFYGVEKLYWNATNCEDAAISPNIKEIYFGDNVEVIPAYFMYKSTVSELKIPNSVTEIKRGAFDCCTNLTELTIPDSVKKIAYGDYGYYGDGAFRNCKNLNRVKIPSSVTQIGSDTFSNSDSDLTIVGYRNSYIEDFAEKNDLMFSALDDKIEGSFTYLYEDGGAVLIDVDNSVSGNVTIPSTLGGKTVTEIGSYAFSGCRNMTGVTIPNTVTRIGIDAFYNCRSLTSVNLPKNVTSIGQYAFSGCYQLSNIQFPQSLKNIPSGLLCECTSLESIEIPKSVTSIGSHAFERSGLKEVVIPDGVIDINNYAFNECKSLQAVQLNEFIENIGYSAFRFTSIENIEIPKTVKKIGTYAFSGCKYLKSLIIDDAPVAIGDNAFSGCGMLSEVALGNSAKWIGNNAFNTGDGAELKAMTVPKSVTSIGQNAFPQYDDFAINGYIGSCTERYCKINDYKFLKIDQLYNHYFYIIENGGATITGTDGLLNGSVVLPDTIEGYPVTKIGEKAFMSRKSISDIKIPANIIDIAYNAFSDCKGLVLQGNEFVYDYTLKRGLTYTEDLSKPPIDFVTVDNNIETTKDGTILGDLTIEIDSHINSFVDMSNIYLAIYCDGVLVNIIQSNILPEIGEHKYIYFKDFELGNTGTGRYTMKIMIWDAYGFRPYAEVYEPQLSDVSQ